IGGRNDPAPSSSNAASAPGTACQVTQDSGLWYTEGEPVDRSRGASLNSPPPDRPMHAQEFGSTGERYPQERQLPKLDVVGSSPISRFPFSLRAAALACAALALAGCTENPRAVEGSAPASPPGAAAAPAPDTPAQPASTVLAKGAAAPAWTGK